MKNCSPGGRLGVAMVMVSAAAVTACGSVGGGNRPPAPVDASNELPDSAPPDAMVAPRCDPAKPFGAPTLVANINSKVRDQGARLVDELTLYFASDSSGTAGLYVATRSSPAEPFGQPVPLTEINATAAASGPSLTRDALTLYYAVTPPGGRGDLYVTRRASKAAAFAAGTAVAMLNSATYDDLDPDITPDDSALYFGSGRANGSNLDLFVAVRRGDGSFDVPQALTSLNTGVTDGHPVLSRDGLTLYWSSDRGDGGAQGMTDIWRASRTSTAGSFGTPARVPELSSSYAESVSWISDDGCMVYLQSNRPGGPGLQDIWQAVKPM